MAFRKYFCHYSHAVHFRLAHDNHNRHNNSNHIQRRHFTTLQDFRQCSKEEFEVKTFDMTKIHEQINARIKHFGSKAAYAKHLGMTAQQLSHSLGHCLTPNGRVLEDIGFEKKTVYCKKSRDG